MLYTYQKSSPIRYNEQNKCHMNIINLIFMKCKQHKTFSIFKTFFKDGQKASKEKLLKSEEITNYNNLSKLVHKI